MESTNEINSTEIIKLVFIGIVVALVMSIFKQCTKEPLKAIQLPGTEKISQIETRLQPIIEKTNYYQSQADNTKPLLKAFESRFDSLNAMFEKYKQDQDSEFMMVYCDSIRNDYAEYQLTSQKVIKSLDSANIGYRTIIQMKDTIIEVYKSDISLLIDQNQKLTRKNGNLKKQRNIIGGAFLAALGFALLK